MWPLPTDLHTHAHVFLCSPQFLQHCTVSERPRFPVLSSIPPTLHCFRTRRSRILIYPGQCVPLLQSTFFQPATEALKGSTLMKIFACLTTQTTCPTCISTFFPNTASSGDLFRMAAKVCMGPHAGARVPRMPSTHYSPCCIARPLLSHLCFFQGMVRIIMCTVVFSKGLDHLHGQACSHLSFDPPSPKVLGV